MTESCLLCGSPQAELLITSNDRLFGIAPGTYSLVECNGCGMVRLSPRPTPEQVAGFYATNYWFAGGRLQEIYRRLVLLDHVHFASRGTNDRFSSPVDKAPPSPGTTGRPFAGARESLVAARLPCGTNDRSSSPVDKAPPPPPAPTILDVGCGGGLFLRMMKERGFNVLGLDFSAEAARLAWEKNGVRVLVGDLPSAAIEPASCALVTMYHVVEHLLDPAAYLRAAARLLQPGGRLIVQVPDRDCWEASLLGANWTGIDVPRHIHIFRSSDLRRLLRSSGFEVVREKHFSLRDHPAGLATGLAPSFDPVVRAIRGIDRSAAARIAKDLLYLGLTAAALPFTLLEAMFGKGSSVTIEARKSDDPH